MANLRPEALHSESSDLCAFAGEVDIDRLAPGNSPTVTQAQSTNVMRITLPGLDVQFDSRRAAWHVTTSSISLVAHCGAAPSECARRFSAAGPARTPIEAIAAIQSSRFSAIHIDLAHRKLVMMTDRFAALPICYSLEGRALTFSDRADSLPGSRTRSIDPQAIFDYVYFHVIPGPRTAFVDVRRMEAGQQLEFDGREVNLRRWWRPTFHEESRPSIGQLKERFVSLLQQAVRRELDRDDVGAYLSGGTDSSTVSGMLGRLRGEPVHTFSIGFADESYDEMAYARIAASHFGAVHHERYVTAEDLLEFIPLVAGHYDQPFGNSSALPAYCCARMARGLGIGKLLAGDGGDELFGGNKRYAKQKVFEAYGLAPAVLRAYLLEPALGEKGALGAVPGFGKLASYVKQARIPMPERAESYNLLARFGAETVFSAEFLKDIDRQAPMHLQRYVYQLQPDAAFVNRMLAYDWRFTLTDTDLPKVTGTSGLAGVSVGFPMLDNDLVDFSLSLPASFKVRGLTLRWFFKEALKDFLPREIVRKKKQGFGLPFGPWLLRHEGLRRFAQDSLTRLIDRRLVCAELVHNLFSSRLEEHSGYYGELVWILMMLEQWLTTRAPTFQIRPADSLIHA